MALNGRSIQCPLRRTLLALALAASPQIALAQPPAPGATHTFLDPVFRGTVFCDTIDQVLDIATAKTPEEAYANYYLTANERNEPICMAIAPTGVVVEVIPIGVMVKNGKHFQAWVIETKIAGTTAFALYLEYFDYVRA